MIKPLVLQIACSVLAWTASQPARTADHIGGSVCGYQPGFAWLVAPIATAGR
jgi:hypothetical protein